MPLTQTVPVILAPTEKWERYKRAKVRRKRAASVRLTNYYHDPVAFVHDCIKWPEGEGTADFQDEILSAIVEFKRVGVRSLHGVGKTTVEALAVLWFALTRDAAGVEWKVITTAGAWRQLEKYLWPEIHKWAKRIRWERLGRSRFTRHQLLQMELKLEHGAAGAVASDNSDYIEGAHADSIFYVFDEAKAIPAATWEAAEGAFTGAIVGGKATEAFALACSTPGEPNGVFYNIHIQAAGYAIWKAYHVTLAMAIAAGRATQQWADEHAALWGETSAAYCNRVLGEFMSSDEDGVIPLAWIEAAVERWKLKMDAKGQLIEGLSIGPLDTVGVDVARQGDDSTVQALRYGSRIHELRTSKYADLMPTAGLVGGVLEAHPGATAIVDTDGLGAGVTDRLRELGHSVYAFHAGAKTENRDKSKELGFVNVRSAAWWRLRELLAPDSGEDLELPDDPELLGDLTAPHWEIKSNSRIAVEAKVDIKKRIGRSPDKGDAVMQAFWEERKKRRRRMHDSTDLGDDPRRPAVEHVGQSGMVAA